MVEEEIAVERRFGHSERKRLTINYIIEVFI